MVSRQQTPIFPLIWNVPYPQNPLFTGREELLDRLATSLRQGQPTALSQPQAIGGLGGIGKTQLALEYAYRYRADYQIVLWVVADTRENLTSSYLTIAALLNLPEKDEQEAARVVAAVKGWFQQNRGWLLVLDNADDLALARAFLPPAFGGHVLLTTRAQTVGRFAHRLEVDVLSTEVGALFLLQRTGTLSKEATLEQASQEDRALAQTICEELGGLPLALDQAGAYIEETGCSLSDYKQRYQARRAYLLKRRGGLVSDHPEAVATTWSLAFEKVTQANPAAADLLEFCAFLAPDAIPEEIINRGAEYLGSVLEPVASDLIELDEAIAALGAYSLMRRSAAEATLSVHRLVQAVLIDQMSEQDRRQWIERAVQAVNAIFPGSGEFDDWSVCGRLLPHVLTTYAHLKTEKLVVSEAAEVLRRAGWYLGESGQYREAETLLRAAFTLHQQDEKKDDMALARAALALAWLYNLKGKYVEAEPLFQQALSVMEQYLGPEHREVADCLINLASFYQDQGKLKEAEPLYQRALTIREQELGPQHPRTATSLNNLAALYQDQGKYEQAELLFQRALAIREQAIGEMHPDTALSVWWLATLSEHQQRDEEAVALYRRAFSIYKHTLGFLHPDTQTIRANYTSLLRKMGREVEAAALDQEA